MLKVLCLEDSPRDFELMREQLTNAISDLEIDCTATESEFVSWLRSRRYDIILSDFKLPGFDAFGALRWTKQICPAVPFVCVSGTVGEDIAMELVKEGAVDYVLKDRLVRLPSAVMRALEEAAERRARRRMEEALAESEERFRNVFEHAAVGKSMTSPDGTVKVNKAFSDMVGYSQEELANLKWQQITHPDDIECDQKIINSMLSGERESARWQKRYLHKKGNAVWVDVATVLQRDSSGRPTYFITTVIDITERMLAEEASKRADEKLQNSEAFLNRLIEQSPLAMWIADDHGTLIRLNHACCELLKISEDEVVGRYNIFQDNIVLEQGFMPLVKEVFERGTTARFEINYDSSKVKGLHLEHTTSVILDVTVFPIIDTNGRITNAVIEHNDITEHKRAEEALRASDSQYRELWGATVEGIAIIDNGTIVEVNDAMCRMFGYSREESVGKSLLHFAPPEVHKSIREKTRCSVTCRLYPKNTAGRTSHVKAFNNFYE